MNNRNHYHTADYVWMIKSYGRACVYLYGLRSRDVPSPVWSYRNEGMVFLSLESARECLKDLRKIPGAEDSKIVRVKTCRLFRQGQVLYTRLPSL